MSEGHTFLFPLRALRHSHGGLTLTARLVDLASLLLQHDRYIKTIVKTAKEQDGRCKFLAAGMINALLAHDPSTNWILGQTGLVNSLITILRDPLAPATVKAEATLGLKHLTTFSQRNRDDVLLSKGIQDLIQILRVRKFQ